MTTQATEKKERRGRKKMPPEEKRSVLRQIYLTMSEDEILSKNMEKNRRTASSEMARVYFSAVQENG